jgi:hypothetical protein
VRVAADEEGKVELRFVRSYPGVAGVQTVSYRLEEAALVRQVLAEDPEVTADTVEMLELRRLEVRCLVDGGWVEAQRLSTISGRAVAIEVALERENGERYIQVLPL